MGAPALDNFYNASQQVARLANVPSSQIVQVDYDQQGMPVFDTVSNLNNLINTIATDIYNASPDDPRFATADPNSPSGYSVFNDSIDKFDLSNNYRQVNNKYVPLYGLEPLQIYNQQVNPLTGNANYNPNNAYTNQLNAFTNLLGNNTASYRPAYSSESYAPIYNTANPASDYAMSQGNYDAGASMGDNYSVGYYD